MSRGGWRGGTRQQASRLTRPRRPATATLSWVTAIAVGVVVGVFRAYRVGPTFDLFYDEILYREMGHTVINGGFPRADGLPFFLHPPAFFYLEAAWERLLGSSSDVVAMVYQARILNSVLAGVSAMLLVLLVTPVAHLRAGVLAGTLFGLDPYVGRINGKVLLETAAMTWVLAGYVLLIPLVTGTSRSSSRRAILAGSAFGAAILTKDMTALITLVPLCVAVLWLRFPRRPAALVMLAAFLPYLTYLVVVATNGQVHEFWAQKTSGIRRLLGLLQISGFHQPGAPGLVNQLARQVGDYGTTYVLLLVAFLAAAVVWVHGTRPARYLTLLYVACGVTLAYAAVRGALEEQFLYLLMVPSVIMVSLAVAVWRSRPVALLAGTVLLLVVLNSLTYVRLHRTSDDGFAQVRSYMVTHLAPGTRVIVVDATGRYALRDQFRVGTWTDPKERRRLGVQYMVVPWREVVQGYSVIDSGIDAAQVRRLATGATKLISVSERSYGEVALYRLPLPAA